MPPTAIFSPADINCDAPLYTRDEIYAVLPQQYEIAQLDGIVHIDAEGLIFAAYRDVRDDEWWCRGHMPGHPIFPGILMVEAAAQLSAFAQKIVYPERTEIMGFGGINNAKFRESVFPPARIILVARAIDTRLRRFACGVQSFVDGRMAFEGEIRGIMLKS